MKLQPVELNHTRVRFWRWGGNGPRWKGEGDVGEVYCLLTSAFFCLICCSVRFILVAIHFERSSFAFLGSFLLSVTGAKHGKESRGVECTVAISGW